MWRFLLALLLISAFASMGLAEPLIKSGDRVVWIGGTTVEREQRFGHWEYVWTTSQPTNDIIFRNLGWSGDTVWGIGRGGFEDAAKGFQRLRELTIALKPTVVVISYGNNEAFAGPEGVEAFKKQLEELINAIEPTKARIVLMTTFGIETKAPMLTDTEPLRKNLAMYDQAIREVAGKRKVPVVTVPPLPVDSRLTINGIHLSEYGYFATAPGMGKLLASDLPEVAVALGGKDVVASSGVIMADVKERSAKITRPTLPMPATPIEGAPEKMLPTKPMTMTMAGLGRGEWTLMIDGKPAIHATHDQWATGVVLETGPDVIQAAELLEKIRQKNQLYFYRWRPQNETYLLGFRRGEQGKNAKEIAEFDPLIAAAEADIARLRKPVAHLYEWVMGVK